MNFRKNKAIIQNYFKVIFWENKLCQISLWDGNLNGMSGKIAENIFKKESIIIFYNPR